MGAVTAIMYIESDPTIGAVILDSPFYSLKKLVKEIVKSRAPIPNFIITSAYKMIKNTIKKKMQFSLKQIEPINYVQNCFIPALFVHGEKDDFVNYYHSQKLYDLYQGDKKIMIVEGDHNSRRPDTFKKEAANFFYNYLQKFKSS
jgi:esterase/lipase